jgi:hypothetical protein
MIAANPANMTAPAPVKLTCVVLVMAEARGVTERNTHTPVIIKITLIGTQPITIINAARIRFVLILMSLIYSIDFYFLSLLFFSDSLIISLIHSPPYAAMVNVPPMMIVITSTQINILYQIRWAYNPIIILAMMLITITVNKNHFLVRKWFIRCNSVSITQINRIDANIIKVNKSLDVTYSLLIISNHD